MSLQDTWLMMSQSGWPSSKQWNWLLFIEGNETLISVLVQVMWVLLVWKQSELKRPWDTVSALGSPTALCPHTWVSDSLNRGAELPCGMPASVELHEQLCQHSAARGLRTGASSCDLCTVCCQMQAHSETSQYLQFYSLSLIWACCVFLN